MNCEITNDSLVFSEIEEQNLLEDSIYMKESISHCQNSRTTDPLTIQFQKRYLKPSFKIQNNPSIYRNSQRQNQIEKATNVKTFKKITKDKEKFLSYDSKIQNVALKNLPKHQRINELVSLIESQKILKQEGRLKQFAEQLIQITDQLSNQKKNLQKQLQNLIQFNKLTTSKLKQIQKFLELKNSCTCNCNRIYSFSKSRTPINSLQRFQFAKTMINSLQQFELKKVQEQQGINMTQLPLIELLWVFKNKVEGSSINVSQGLLDRIASGPTLKSWISSIDQKITSIPKVSEFSVVQNKKQGSNSLNQFIQILKQNEQTFINNIKNSKDPLREIEMIEHSTLLTFTQILREQVNSLSKSEAIANFGQLNRCLKIIQKKVSTSLNFKQDIINRSSKYINNWIQNYY